MLEAGAFSFVRAAVAAVIGICWKKKKVEGEEALRLLALVLQWFHLSFSILSLLQGLVRLEEEQGKSGRPWVVWHVHDVMSLDPSLGLTEFCEAVSCSPLIKNKNKKC